MFDCYFDDSHATAERVNVSHDTGINPSRIERGHPKSRLALMFSPYIQAGVRQQLLQQVARLVAAGFSRDHPRHPGAWFRYDQTDEKARQTRGFLGNMKASPITGAPSRRSPANPSDTWAHEIHGLQEVGTMKQVVSLREPKSDGLSLRLRKAEARHRELDARLQELGRRAYLTPPEQRELTEIKKHKLRAKDEMAALQRAL